MKNFKRILCMLLVCAMIVPMGIISSATPELTNWTTSAGKYSASTKKLIAPSKDGYAIKDVGFEFTENDKGGVSVVTPNYDTFAGVYGTSVITSKATTPLDGLTVVIEPDEFDFMIDSAGVSNSISVLWTEEPINAIAERSDPDSGDYDIGLTDSEKAGTNGLRHMIPVIPGQPEGIPAADATTTNGKALYISVSNGYGVYADTLTASNVTIVYYDGSYINANDGHPGYRWTFTARNRTDMDPKADSSGIVSPFQEIDLTYGLTVKVKPDETYGYIVNINGVDYYKGKRVAGDDASTPIVGYYPDALVDGTSHDTLTDEDYAKKTDKYINSMTFARNDIDLSGLKDAGEGYVTVGTVSINDRYFEDHSCNYTVSAINTVPAANWQGESFPADHVCDYAVEEVPATCTQDGAKVHSCTCGATYSERIVALGHDMILDTEISYDATCTAKGREVMDCSRCDNHTDKVLPALGHSYDDWYVAEVATPDAKGTKARDCIRCDAVETKEYSYSGTDDVVENWEITGTNGWEAVDPTLESVVNAVVNDDNSITVQDLSAITGNNISYNTVTKAANKNHVSINGFNVSVTPEPLNANFPDMYPQTLSFTLTNAYERYNYATEYSTGYNTKQLPEHYAGIPSDEVLEFGNTWGHPYSTDTIKEYTVTITLMDYKKQGNAIFGVKDDGYYDIAFWSLRSAGNHWTHKYEYLHEPIKMGDEIFFELYYEKDLSTGNNNLFYCFNADWDEFSNIFTMDSCHNSQSEDAIYHFIMAAHSPIIANPEATAESLSASSYTINSICGEDPMTFDGYYCDSEYNTEPADGKLHNCVVADNAKWVVVENATCTENGVEARYCMLCGEPAETREIVSTGEHTPAGDWIVTTPATCLTNGEQVRYCAYCGEVAATMEIIGSGEHTPGEPVVVEPDYFNEGTTTVTCTTCGEVLSREVTPVPEYVNKFTDVKDTSWFASQVAYCVKRGYITGMTETTFKPNGNLTRAQFVTILAKLDGVDLTAYSAKVSPFTDVKVGAWFHDAVTWAAEDGYVAGITTTTFKPNNKVTRQQLAAFFYRYASANGVDVSGKADLSVFPDANKVQSYAKDAIQWAVDAGIINGIKSGGVTTLAPGGNATRAQAAVMFMAFDNFRGLND